MEKLQVVQKDVLYLIHEQVTRRYQAQPRFIPQLCFRVHSWGISLSGVVTSLNSLHGLALRRSPLDGQEFPCQDAQLDTHKQPTKGVDVGAKAEIYAIMGDLAKKGYAIILISSEMPEILGMSDRIIVMCNGRKTGELNRGEATQEGILELSMEKSTGKGTK